MTATKKTEHRSSVLCQMDLSLAPEWDNADFKDKLKSCLNSFFHRLQPSEPKLCTLSPPVRFLIKYDPQLESCYLCESEVNCQEIDNALLEKLVQKRLE